jgi:hypothetical protein
MVREWSGVGRRVFAGACRWDGDKTENVRRIESLMYPLSVSGTRCKDLLIRIVSNTLLWKYRNAALRNGAAVPR